jgi:hypothetical protein
VKTGLALSVLAVAAVAGALYTLSPLTVCCLLSMAALIRWTAKDIGGSERRWLLTALGAALAARAVAIGILAFLIDPRRDAHTSYLGDAQYAIQRSIWIRNAFLHIPVAPHDYIEAFEPAYGWSSYNYFLAYFHVLLGPSPFGSAFLSTALFLSASAILFRVCRRAFGPLAASGGLFALLLFPSWFGWSVVPMREALQFLLLTVALVAAIAVLRGRRPFRWPSVAGLVAALLLTATLKGAPAWIGPLAIVLGWSLWLVMRRWWTIAVAAAIVLCLAFLAANDASARARVAAQVEHAAARHLGHVRISGFSYKVLDEKFYAPSAANDLGPGTLTVTEGARFLIRAIFAFFIMPAPWVVDRVRWLGVVPMQVEWGLLLVLSAFGVIAGLRQDALLTWLLFGFVVAGVVVIAPNSGNIGTLVRHRDTIVPFLAALAGVGGMAVARRALVQNGAVRAPGSSLRQML